MDQRKKIKSGAQKVREKCMKLQIEQAKKCHNILSFFPSSKSSTIDSSQDDKKNIGFVSEALNVEPNKIMPKNSSHVYDVSMSHNLFQKLMIA